MQTCQLVIKFLSDFLKTELFISSEGFDPFMIQQPPPTSDYRRDSSPHKGFH